MASQVTLKALGLNYSPNNLALPEGSLLAANDVIIRRDNVVESRRGFKDYSQGLGLTTQPIKQLIEYKERILAHYSNRIAYDTLTQNASEQNIFNNFPGNFSETEAGLRIKSIVANKNLYFTSSEGIKKISAKTADDFSTLEIVDAGAVKALDVSANLNITQGQSTGFLPVDSTVAYRVLWGYKDANDNLIYGTPSERTLVYNYLTDIIPLDFNTLLNLVDNLKQEVVITTVGTGATPTITTSTNHGLTTGDIVNIVGVTTTPTNAVNGSFSVTVLTNTTFQITASALVTVGGSGSNIGTLTKSLFSDANYYNLYKLNIEDSAQTFKQSVISFAEKLDNDLLFANDTGLGTPYVPLKMNTVQINAGSIGQVNFASSPVKYFSEGDKVKIDGFTTEPTTVNLSLTNVGGTATSPQNPATIAYNTSTAVITNGQEITITGTNTSASTNGTFTATVTNNTISSTTGGASVSISSITTANPATITAVGHGLSIGDAIWISGTSTTTVPAGGLNGLMYVVSFGATPANEIRVSSTRGGTAIQTTAVATGTGTLVKELTVNTSTAHLISTGDYINITGANATPAINQSWFVTTSTSGTSTFKILPTSAITVQATAGTVYRTTIPVSVNSVTTGTGNISVTTFNNLKLFNNNFTITKVDGISNYIQFTIPNNTVTFTSTAIDSTAKLYSYNYTDIVTTGDDTYSTSLSNLNPSTPATSEDLRIIQNNIFRIASRLKNELNGVISTTLQTSLISPYNITTAGDVDIVTTVPTNINSNYFYQIYRTRVFTAEQNQTLGSLGQIPVNPDDEMNLVYESFPTQAELVSDTIEFTDNYPEDLASTNAYLYTNPVTGQGILQANDTPPFAKDINVFKNSTFYANTKTKQRLNPFQLIGTSNISSVNNNNKITIGNDEDSITYIFTPGVQEKTLFTFNQTDTEAAIKGNIQNRYIVLNTPVKKYYAWFKYDNKDIKFSSVVSGVGITTFTTVDPHNLPVSSKIFISGLTTATDVNGVQTISNVTGLNTFEINTACGAVTSYNNAFLIPYVDDAVQIQVNVLSSDAGTQCAIKFNNAIASIANDFTCTNLFEITNIAAGTPTTTITTAADHGLTAGDKVFISGVTQTSGTTIDGLQTIVAAGTNTFTISTGSVPVNPAYSGAIVLTGKVYITNVDEGIAKDSTNNVLGSITSSVVTQGDGEDWESNIRYIDTITPGSPTTIIKTTEPHGLSTPCSVAISEVTQSGGTNLNSLFEVVSIISPTEFSIGTSNQPEDVVDTYGKVTIKGVYPKVLLSQVESRSQAIDTTARSLVRVINRQPSSSVYAFYVSGEETSPGIINLETKVLTDPNFYVLASNMKIGESFTPDISPPTLNNISQGVGVISGSGTTFTLTSTSHGLRNQDQVMISGSNSNPIIDGIYTVSNCTINTFDITFISNFVSTGTYFAWSKLSQTAVSTNEEKQNRVYFSKSDEPEAVPILNFLDVGSSDKAILRIFPLRDSLFVFKEDGLYRISGEEIPFVLTLFDSSCIVLAPDSVSVSDNIIYGWTVKGISNITESGTAEISRPIDTEVLKLAASKYTNFKTATWGVGYDSDNSYTVYTTANVDDQYATIGFRYSDLTNTWTNVNRAQNCGIVLSGDNKLYIAGSEDNLIYQERKNFDRTDYADDEFNLDVVQGNITNIPNEPVGTRIYFLNSISDISVGDAIAQKQIVTQYGFNALLQKLDLDPTVGVVNIASTSNVGNLVTINTVSNHNLTTGNYVTLQNTNGSPVLDGDYQVTVTSLTSFTIVISGNIVTPTTSGKVKRNYYLTLKAENGDSLRNKLIDLASYLDTDPALSFSGYSTFVANHIGAILSNSVANPTEITTSSAHNLVNGRLVTITGTPASPISDPTLKDQTFAVTVTSPTTFTVPLNVITAGSSGLSFSTVPNDLNKLDIQACFNAIITELNVDSGASFTNYKLAEDESLLEAVILNVNYPNKYIDLNLPLSWTDGQITIYKAIPCGLVYAPITFGDPLSLKQIYEATMMFENKAFTKATASFNTDLKPQFIGVDFYGQGNGIFGHYSNPGFGYGFFGGLSNSAPFRTIIPRESQRCRFLTVKFDHSVAREKWALNGITLTGNVGLSSRGYR